MSRLSDSAFLKGQQYKTPTHLSARIALHECYTICAQPWHEWVMDRILAAAPADARVLEIGCGRGDLWEQNRQRIPPGWSITLADLSSGMVREARRRVHGGGFDMLGFAAANVEWLPFASNGFDVVVANHMLYHAPDRTRALHEARRVLKLGGRFFASTNGDAHLRELFDAAERALPRLREYRESLRRSFTLDNGAPQIEGVFQHVEVSRYPSELHVDAAQPLVDFIASMSPALDAGDSLIAQLHEIYASEIASGGGAIRISTDVGLFMAW